MTSSRYAAALNLASEIIHSSGWIDQAGLFARDLAAQLDRDVPIAGLNISGAFSRANAVTKSEVRDQIAVWSGDIRELPARAPERVPFQPISVVAVSSNVAIASPGAKQELSVSAGNKDELLEALENLGVSKAAAMDVEAEATRLLNTADASLQLDDPGSRINQAIHFAASNLAAAAVQAPIVIGLGLVTAVVAQFLGIS